MQQRIRRMGRALDTANGARKTFYDVHGRAFGNTELLPFVDFMWTCEVSVGTRADGSRHQIQSRNSPACAHTRTHTHALTHSHPHTHSRTHPHTRTALRFQVSLCFQQGIDFTRGPDYWLVSISALPFGTFGVRLTWPNRLACGFQLSCNLVTCN